MLKTCFGEYIKWLYYSSRVVKRPSHASSSIATNNRKGEVICKFVQNASKERQFIS